METTLTKRGQTAVPAEIRKRYKLKEGDTLAWIDDGKTIRVVFLPAEPVKASWKMSARAAGTSAMLTARMYSAAAT